MNVSLAPSMGKHSPFLVRTTLSLLESGGRPVVRNLERIVWPAAKLIGVRPLFTGSYANEDGPVDFEVVRVDQAGAAQPEADLPVRLFREDRQYYWRFDDQRGWNSGFSESDELVATQTVSVQAGARGKLRVPVRYGRYRLEIDDPESHQTLKYRFYAGWSFQQDEQAGVRPDRVALELDKPAYNEGDTITVKVKAPHDGTALITLEGDRTLWVKRTEVSAGGTTISVPLDKSWAHPDTRARSAVHPARAQRPAPRALDGGSGPCASRDDRACAPEGPRGRRPPCGRDALGGRCGDLEHHELPESGSLRRVLRQDALCDGSARRLRTPDREVCRPEGQAALWWR
jgi:uncharacterized protein YfaS (alpha-2-macroglobulin family)